MAKRSFYKARENVKDHPDQRDLLDELEEKRTEFYESSINSGIAINMARNEFFCKQLSSFKGDSRSTYKIVNKLLDKEYGSNKTPNGDEQDVAERLKSFFEEKVKSIYSNIEDEVRKSSIPVEDNNASETSKDVNCTLQQFYALSESELKSIILDLPNKSSPLDAIPMWLFKNCLPELLPIVLFIVNESLQSGEFPQALKTASVRPGLKKPTLDVDGLKNY